MPPTTPPMPDALAYFITWVCYGTWLPGDARGWIEYRSGWQLPDPVRELEARAIMSEDAIILGDGQRNLVEKTIADHCRIKRWQLHAVNCRTNHVHVVASAPVKPKQMQQQFKGWCTIRLKELDQSLNVPNLRDNWWAERGSQRWIFDEISLDRAIQYVREGQDWA